MAMHQHRSPARSLCYQAIHSLLLLLLTATTWLLLATCSRADDVMGLSLEELMEVRISGSTLGDDTIRSVPAAVTVFTHEELQRLNVSQLRDILNLVPGYQCYETDARSTFASRGRRLAGVPREVLVLLDGQRLNHDWAGAAYEYESLFSLANVERIEFLRGPGSPLYGANAFLGIINIISRHDGNQLLLAGGKDRYNASARLTQHSDDRHYVSFHLDSSNENAVCGHLFNAFNQKTEPSCEDLLGQTAYVQGRADNWSWQWRETMTDNNGGYVYGTTGNSSNNDSLTALRTHSGFMTLQYQRDINTEWHLESILNDSRFESSIHVPSKTQSGIPFLIRLRIGGTETSFTNRLSWQRNAQRLLMGLELQHANPKIAQGRNQLLNNGMYLPYYDISDKSPRDIRGLFVQWQDTLAENLDYIAGIRNDHYTDVSGHTSPRAGLIWHKNSNNTLKLLYGEAFRAPARNELSITNNPLQYGNPDLDPEISRTTEMIWIHSNNHHYLSAGLFSTRIEDAIVYTNTNPRTFANGTLQNISGLELEWQWFAGDDWQLNSTWSQLFKEALKINPEAGKTGSITWLGRYHHSDLRATLRYHGSSHDENVITGYTALDPYWLLDIAANYKLASGWNLYGRIDNVANTHYTQPAIQGGTNPNGVPNIRQATELGIRWQW